MGMQPRDSHCLGTSILWVTMPLAFCLLAFTLAAPPAQAGSQRGDLSKNVRYCNDRPECIEGDKTKHFVNEEE